MNCPNCGAPMALSDDPLAWHCDHCGTAIRIADGDGKDVQLLGTRPGRSLQCPVCHQALEAAAMDSKYRLDACGSCRGLLLDREVFAATVDAKRRSATTASTMPKRVSRRQLDRRINCPSCAATMLTDWYYGPGHVVIDRCETCDLVWLDGGELQTIVEAPGPDRVL